MIARPVTPPEAPAEAVARDLLTAIERVDLAAIERLLLPDVWCRVLLPRRVLELNDAGSVVAAYAEWFATAAELEPLALGHHPLAGREHVSYRFRLRPEWAPETWHVIEQCGYVRVDGDRIRRLDLVCTGFHPVE